VLATSDDSVPRLERVAEVIDGFETPYGMELLSTVHWVGRHADPPVSDAASAIAAVQAWNERKKTMFRPTHISVAWTRLKDTGWLP